MNLKDILRKINNCENHLDIKNINYINFNPWPMIRLMTVHKVNVNNNCKNVAMQNSLYKKILLKIKTLIVSFYKYIKNPIKKEKIDILYFTRKSELQDIIHQKLFNRYSDTLKYFFDEQYKIKVLEIKDNEIDADVTYIDFLIKIVQVKIKIKKLFKLNQNFDVRSINDVIKSEFNFTLDIVTLKNNLFLIYELSLMFEKILKKLDPKVVFLVCFYRVDAMAMSLACHNLGIKTVEYQHGAQNDNHLMYTSWLHCPKKGYELIPDTFWMWGDINKQRIDKWATKTNKHKAIIGGNMWLAYNKKISIGETIEKIDNDKLTILVSLQGDSFIPEFFIEFIEKFGSNYNWYFRDHPRIPISNKIKSIFEKYAFENFETTAKYNLYSLLKVVDVNITGFSTVAFEAQSFDKLTIFTHENAKNGFNNLLNKDGFIYVDTKLALNETLDKIRFNKLKIKNYYIISDSSIIYKTMKEIIN